MSKHHKHSKHRREEFMPPYQEQQFPQPGQPMNGQMFNNPMGNNPMGSGQMGNNPMGNNPMGNNPLMGLMGGLGGGLGAGLLNNPLMRMLGSIDIGAISQLLLGNKAKGAAQGNLRGNNNRNPNIGANPNNNQNPNINSRGNPIADLLNNLNDNDVNEMMNSIDQNQISSILKQLNLNDPMVSNVENRNDSFDIGEYHGEDGSTFHMGNKSYSASEVMNIVSKLLDTKNTEFLDKVLNIYDEYK